MTKLDRLCETVVSRIERGVLRAGDRLPSEAGMATDFGVSVGTVQRALSRLAQTGMVSREHGRGTFVSGTRIGPSGVNYLRFRDASGRELPHWIRVESIRRVARRGPWSVFLGDDPAHVRIERTIRVGGRWSMFSEFWLREAEFERLDRGDDASLEGNLRVLLGRELSLPTLRLDQWIRFERMPDRVARRLGLDADAPGFAMELRGYTLRDRPLFYQRVFAGPFGDSLVVLR